MTTKTTMKLPARMIACLLALAASPTFAVPQPATPKDATEATRVVNRAALADLPMSDKQSFEDARRGLVGALGDQVVMGDGGRPVWSLQGYEFLAKEEAPDTVSPGLWRQARVNMVSGLFKVTERRTRCAASICRT
jgi:alkyl sulfatase BDS1-like metallo-beta-lactamase superfamily hydrolase